MTLFKHLGTNIKFSIKFIYITRYETKKFNSIYNKFYERSPLKLILPHQYVNRKYCYHFKVDDTGCDNEDVDYRCEIKNYIFPYNNDALATKISESKSLQEVFELIRHNEDQLNWKNISMGMAMVRELQIIYNKVYMYEKSFNCSNIVRENNFENILTNDDFLNLLDLMDKHCKFMNINCLSYNILSLHKIGVDLNCTIYQKLLQRLKILIMTTPVEEIECCILSRFTISIMNHRKLTSLYTVKDIWPIILKKLSKFIYLYLFIYLFIYVWILLIF